MERVCRVYGNRIKKGVCLNKRVIFASTVLCTALYCTPVMAQGENINNVPTTVQDSINVGDNMYPIAASYNSMEEMNMYIAKAQEFYLKLNNLDKSNLETFYINYKQLLQEYSPYISEPLALEDIYTKEQITYIDKCIETEFHGADFECKTHGASVIFNRIKDPRYPDDPIAVVTQAYQFKYGRDNIDESTKLAVEYADTFGDTAQNCTMFDTNSKLVSYGEELFCDATGTHYYKLKD